MKKLIDHITDYTYKCIYFVSAKINEITIWRERKKVRYVLSRIQFNAFI